MNRTVAKLYRAAPRFDEGEFFDSKEYGAVMERQLYLHDLLVATFGQQIEPLLEEYTETLYDVTELEAKHFFQEGYRARSGTEDLLKRVAYVVFDDEAELTDSEKIRELQAMLEEE